MILAIVVAIMAYRSATATGRNGWLWALIGAALFVGTQMVVTLGAGILIGLGTELLGWSEAIYDDTMVVGPVTVVALGSSILASWLLLRYLGKPIKNEEPTDLPPPPPPPTFGHNQ